MPIGPFIAEARRTLRHDGLAILLWRAMAKTLSPLLEIDRQILFVFDLTQPIEQRRARVDCRIEPATMRDVDELVDRRIPPLPARDESKLSDAAEFRLALAERDVARARATARTHILHWLRAGEVCIVARVDGAIAHSNWIRFHGCAPAPHREIDPREGEIYMTEGYTVPEWRGKALHEAVNTFMLRFAQARGCHCAYTITDYTNARPRRGVLRVGWRRQGHHLFLTPRRLGRTWMLPLGGDVGPIVRNLRGEPVRLL